MGNIAVNITQMKSVDAIIERIAEIKPSKLAAKNEDISPFKAITLKDLSIKTESKVLLDNVSYHFEPGKRYILNGESGSGKTTLFNAIIGQRKDYDGKILLGSEEIRDMDERKINSSISYCRQSPFLFIGSLIDNITVFEENPNMDKVQEVLHLCQLDDFASSRGVETELDNNENSISLGEMQR